MARILIVDDEQNIRRSLKAALDKRQHNCVTAESLAKARYYLSAGFDLVLLDIMLGDGNGLDLLQEIATGNPETAVIMISGHADIDTAVKAIHLGAYDFIEKPLSLDRILVTIDNATRTSRLRQEKDRLSGRVYPEMIGQSESIRKLRADIARSAPKANRFLLLGENGTGKELAAHMIHRHSKNSDGPFVAVNCAALPSELVEAELFGHTKGAFTGATKERPGRFVQAAGGSIFLDEIGEMSAKAQAKILRVIETSQVVPVGSDQPVSIDCIIIAASNRNLEQQAANGSFRQDLYYRLNVVTFELSPLRERTYDIKFLAEHFLNRFAEETGDRPKVLADDARVLLEQQKFDGNVRELRNLMERLNIYCDSDTITAEFLKPYLKTQTITRTVNLREAVEKFERKHIRQVLASYEGNMTEAARQLGLERSHLYKKLKKLGIDNSV